MDPPSIWHHYGEQRHSGVLKREEGGHSVLCPVERGKSPLGKQGQLSSPGLMPRAMSGSSSLGQQLSVLMSMTPVGNKNHGDTQGLSHHM